METNNEDNVERRTRERKHQERLGHAIHSNISKLFHVRGEDNRNSVFSIQEVTSEEIIINREMLEGSRQLELRGWNDLQVGIEVSIYHMLRSNVRPLLNKRVDVWNTDIYGSRKMKSRPVRNGQSRESSQAANVLTHSEQRDDVTYPPCNCMQPVVSQDTRCQASIHAIR